MARIARIWRHPIKSHGREPLAEVHLTEGACIPGDRAWAVAHEASRFDEDAPAWQPCTQFSIGTKSPRLQAMTAETLPDGRIALTHPEREPLAIDPEQPGDRAAFIDWARPLANPDRPMPARLVRAGRGMTDSEYPSISLINLASHAQVVAELGQEISPRRWRGNLLIEGWAPWSEREMVGRRLRIGDAELEVREQITRCLATTASTRTGQRDADTLGALRRGWDHQQMGIYAVVTRGGTIREGDEVSTL